MYLHVKHASKVVGEVVLQDCKRGVHLLQHSHHRVPRLHMPFGQAQGCLIVQFSEQKYRKRMIEVFSKLMNSGRCTPGPGSANIPLGWCSEVVWSWYSLAGSLRQGVVLL
ncbi:hypothetical protein E2C01_005380 [Portunus trituberculatus]|uniref:Uncharacterized protein n=1 Tax=Portunus trituberculatus TaxID=210409 RepID=A0A5B7CTW9_PORTR|nr:hypothetical protein [Portunus trituberculatus]